MSTLDADHAEEPGRHREDGKDQQPRGRDQDRGASGKCGASVGASVGSVRASGAGAPPGESKQGRLGANVLYGRVGLC